MATVIITKENFKAVVRDGGKPVLLDFYADWCGPCRMMAPVFERLSEEREDVIFGKVNVDEQTEIARSFEISSIPTVVLVKDGVIAGAKVGLASRAELLSLID